MSLNSAIQKLSIIIIIHIRDPFCIMALLPEVPRGPHVVSWLPSEGDDVLLLSY